MKTRQDSWMRLLFRLMLIITLQNVVAFSVNMADNLMLGRYGQAALSGAATVNQIQFIVQQVTLGISEGLAAIAAQYWGEGRMEPIARLTGIALWCGLVLGVLITGATLLVPEQILRIFTDEPTIIAEGMAYLRILRWSYLLFIVTQILMAALRSVGTVRISFGVSVVSLIVNVGINYTLIFGNFGAPQLGIRGAAIGTLTARVIELLLVVGYIALRDRTLHLFRTRFWAAEPALWRSYLHVTLPLFLSQILWSISVPMQTAVLGRLSADAIAANSVSTTVYQYLKVVTISEASAFAVVVGRAIGEGNRERVIAFSRKLQLLSLVIGLALGLLLLALRKPLLSIYSLSDTAMRLADQMIVLLSVVMVGMAYQMPVSSGILRGGGDTKYFMKVNIVSMWGIVMPLMFLSAFVWRWPMIVVVGIIQSDQLFKCLPAALRVNGDKWIHKLTTGV